MPDRRPAHQDEDADRHVAAGGRAVAELPEVVGSPGEQAAAGSSGQGEAAAS
jgi:hypothetical protein